MADIQILFDQQTKPAFILEPHRHFETGSDTSDSLLFRVACTTLWSPEDQLAKGGAGHTYDRTTFKPSQDYEPCNRRFPEITGEDNLTMFTYSGRAKSPEWWRQRRRADLRHFEIFRHGPIIICTSLPAGNLLSDLHVPHEQ